MVDITMDIYRLLKQVGRVTLEFPTTGENFPVITLTEVSNIENYSVEGVERFSEITYQVDVWDNGDSRKEVERIACEISQILTQHEFKRVLGRGFRDPSGLHRKMMYFKALALNK